MLQMESFENVIQITIEKENNLFLVKENDGFILIDTTVASDQIEEVIEFIQTSGLPLKAIAITHSHDDHLDGFPQFQKAFPNAPVYFPEREYQLILKKELLPSDKQVPLKEGIPDSLPFTPDLLLKSGDKVGELEVLFTPGHTPGHICFFHPTLRYLLVGDVLQTLGGAAICGVHRDAFPKPARLNWDLEQSIHVVEDFLTLNPTYVGTGHGEVMQDPMSILPKTIAEAKSLVNLSQPH
ncbi:MBL fold metallo-hydrolase [Jeotgalibaca ciconiae]|uniref:MBL fold metallo-hydrolase n=1 Tax=Jeotgalibaca ciconiae TaxID=2496265 RepID=A0A3S9HBR4_9LACT|nr:MBL fold metallo-hydrolase [Jeotgalibaca ciconiae]AZP04761.1 MBL fold metallo-hydrolase [Jeotgalibaca ciconiae]HJB24685.1 MBL fold metallo-hydrolase [Candidatus Jeotgalibaca pullicola]